MLLVLRPLTKATSVIGACPGGHCSPQVDGREKPSRLEARGVAGGESAAGLAFAAQPRASGPQVPPRTSRGTPASPSFHVKCRVCLASPLSRTSSWKAGAVPPARFPPLSPSSVFTSVRKKFKNARPPLLGGAGRAATQARVQAPLRPVPGPRRPEARQSCVNGTVHTHSYWAPPALRSAF